MTNKFIRKRGVPRFCTNQEVSIDTKLRKQLKPYDLRTICISAATDTNKNSHKFETKTHISMEVQCALGTYTLNES